MDGGLRRRPAGGAWVHVDGAFGLWAAGARAGAGSCAGASTPTRGRPTRTSGSTCPTTAASRSCATATPTARRWRSRPPTSAGRAGARADGLEPRVLPPGAGAAGLCGPALAGPRAACGAGGPPVRMRRPLRRAARGPARARGARPGPQPGPRRPLGPDGATDRLVARVQADGTCWASATTWRGRRCIRISVCSWRTTLADVDRSADAIARALAPRARRPRCRTQERCCAARRAEPRAVCGRARRVVGAGVADQPALQGGRALGR